MIPKLSIVLATDADSTIRPVVEHLRSQTLTGEIELVLVCPGDLSVAREYAAEFAAIRTVVDPVDDLARARAAGVRGATAPLVFIGETHSFPAADFAERTVAAFADRQWAVVVPALCNANPRGVLSWSGFLCDYGPWAPELPEGETMDIPVYNATFRRDRLLALGERLPAALDQSDDLVTAFRAAGWQALFLPSTCVFHANAAELWAWVHNRFLVGHLVSANRSRTWRWPRRMLYASGAFLVPAVLLPRLIPGWRVRVDRGPAGTMAAVLLALVLRAAGETMGYAGLFVRSAEAGMLACELHKLDRLGRR